MRIKKKMMLKLNFLKTMFSESKRMSLLIQDLLSLSGLNEPNITLQPKKLISLIFLMKLKILFTVKKSKNKN